MSFWRRLLNKDAPRDLDEVVVNLGFLADAEERIAEFYRACSDAMPKEAELWNSLAEQEVQHADNARKMIERITRAPSQFKPGIACSTVTIRMFAMEMQGLLERMREGKIPQNELFSVALEIESSAIEIGYCKLAKTQDGIFNMLARQNDNESTKHKSEISSRMTAVSIAQAIQAT